jgi:hypothetical protein
MPNYEKFLSISLQKEAYTKIKWNGHASIRCLPDEARSMTRQHLIHIVEIQKKDTTMPYCSSWTMQNMVHYIGSIHSDCPAPICADDVALISSDPLRILTYKFKSTSHQTTVKGKDTSCNLQKV